MSQGSKEITAVSLCLINWLKIIVLLTPHWAKWQIKPELFLAGLCFQQFTWCLVLLPDGKIFFIVAAKQKKKHITRKEEKKVPVPFNNHYMGIAERFLWEQKKWEVWKSRRVVSFQSPRINEPTSCSSMLGFHTAMKSSFLSSTKDVAHLFGMTAFLFFFQDCIRFLSVRFCCLEVCPRFVRPRIWAHEPWVRQCDVRDILRSPELFYTSLM